MIAPMKGIPFFFGGKNYLSDMFYRLYLGKIKPKIFYLCELS